MNIFVTTKGHLVPTKKHSHVWNATLLMKQYHFCQNDI